MDVVATVQKCLGCWDKGGEAECRILLTGPHSNPSDPSSNDVLSTVYHTFIISTLQTWFPSESLSPQALVKFIQSILESLPSPSSTKPSHAVLFGELLVDLIWTVDAELDDIYQDSKVALLNAEQGNGPIVADGVDATAVLARVAKAKQTAEADKETLAGTVNLLVACGILDSDVCRERLELPMLHHAGLIPDEQAFQKKEVRVRTALFYKQNKFNLLREQSEGYSKLTTELTSSLGPPHSSATGESVEPLSAVEARARPTWERVVGLVGYFDLDPNRALDIILDVFSVHLSTHYSFFLALLSCSPWAASPKIKTEDAMNVEPSPDIYRGKSLDEILRLAECQSGNAPRVSQPLTSEGPTGSRVLAQVLGFKFTYYQLPDVMESTPRNLYLTAALLIREGFITLEDIYPHLSLSDEDMEAEHKKYLASIDSRIAGAKVSMLAMAAPLESSLSSSGSKARPATPAEPKKPGKEMPNQKLGILNALLALGVLRPALALMSKYPWMVDASPEIADLMLRILKHCASPIYEAMIGQREAVPHFTTPKARYGTTGLAPAPEKKPQLTLWAPIPPPTNTTNFVFFFSDWTSRIPQCRSMEDLVDVLEPLMSFVGLHISRDPVFIGQLSRMGRFQVFSTITIDPETKRQVGTPDPDHPARVFWFKIIRLYLIPAMPLIRGNAVCTVEIWNVVRLFEVTQRWRLYGEWRDHTYKSHPELRVRQIQADREAKGIMRRLSHNTIDSLSGAVAKLAHSNPIIFFTNAVNQIMAYDNLASVVIIALNYVTIMGFDVLLFVVLDAFANPNKERVKDDGVNTSDWLQSLASFTGMLFRRYQVDLMPMLKYIVHQLHNGQTSEIIVLRELIWKMAGIEPLPSLSDAQVAAMAGGPTLQIEAVASNTRGARMDPGDSKVPARLGKVLVESGLALPLLIQVAQQRQACIYQAPNTPLKSLAGLYDQTHGVLLQYLDFLTSPTAIPPEDYAEKVLPPLRDLHELYGISAPICMQIIRPTLHLALLNLAIETDEKEQQAIDEAEKRLKAALTAKKEPNSTVSRVGSPTGADPMVIEQGSELQAGASREDVSMEGDKPREPTSAESPWIPQLSALFDDVKAIAPDNANEIIGPGFYLTFWQLSTYDLSPPLSRYTEETKALRIFSTEEESRQHAADRSSDRAKRATGNMYRDRRYRIAQITKILTEELKQQTAARGFTIKRLAREKNHWFSRDLKGSVLAAAIVEHCLHPRALLSPMDADYCAQIIKVIHLQGTPGFSTLNVYDKVLSEHIRVMIFTCSEHEARNYGRFLLGVLADIWKWHQHEELFMQDNRVKTGNKVAYLPGFMMTFSNKSVVPIEDIMKWQQFHQVSKKWHRKLYKGIIDCIESGEFMHVYNAIIVLKEILPVFPIAAVNEHAGPALEMAIEKFVEKEERGDLKILGRAYAASFKKRESIWSPPQRAGKPSASGSSVSMKQTPSATPAPSERPRPTGHAAHTGATTANGRPTTMPSGAPPSGPRADIAHLNGNTAEKTSVSSSTRFNMDSIPRPEVVKRVRPDNRRPETPPKTNGQAESKPEPMAVDTPTGPRSQPTTTTPTAPRKDESGIPRGPAGSAVRPASPVVPSGSPVPRNVAQMESSRPPTPSPLVRSVSSKDLPQSPRILGGDMRGFRSDASQVMPPPTIPSQTTSAHELRETAKQTRPSDKADEKQARPPAEPKGQQASASASAPPPRRRSQSPQSRPGTRNHSTESRASGGRSRGATGDSERSEDKRDREGRHESRRDVHGRSSRSTREGDREKETDRDKDRGRDRHGDRERARERDREHKDRDGHRDRDRDRDRDRHRDSERDKDRHRRDEKDRDRDSRKDRENSGRSAPTGPSSNAQSTEDRVLPARPDASRRREDEALGKRRRPTDDDSERASKRPSRKESHHEDRNRRASEKDREDRTRDSERRRKDRDQPEGESRSLTVDTKLGEKRIPDGPASASLRALPPTTPSAPRAMASGDGSKNTKPDREWRARDQPPRGSPTGPSTAQSGQEPPQGPSASLRSRIGDKEPRSIPQGPSGYRNEAGSDRKAEGAGTSKDDRDNSRKRASSEREISDSTGRKDQSSMPAKRPRIDRTRYQGSGAASATSSAAAFAKKSLMDTEKNGRGGIGRKD